MKKILLTTTALVMTAGVAAAEITFSGTGGIALVDDNGAHAVTNTQASLNAAAAAAAAAAADAADKAANDGAATAAAQAANDAAATAAATAATAAANKAAAGATAANAAARAANSDMRIVSYYDMDVAASASTDIGATFAFGFDMGAGEKVDYDDDDMIEVQGAAVGDADVSVTYNGWTLTVDQNGIDNLFDDTQQEDMKIAGTVAGFSVAYAADLENDTNSYSVGYTQGDLTLGFTGTNNDDAGGDATGISASYAMGDITLSGSVSDESDNGEDDTSIGIKYAMDALTLSYTSIQPGKDADLGDEWDMSIGYSAGAMTASFAVDEADATTVIASFDLGGATAFAAMHDKAGTDNDLTTFGVNFAF
jgi:outer membrane protein OmpU